MTMFNQPMGGTELMYNELKSRVPFALWDSLSIFNYASNADFNKPTVYWNQLSYDQEAVQFLKDLQYIEKIKNFVFVSDWQAEIFRKNFVLNGANVKVIKNACIGVKPQKEKENKKIKICYTSTPWRGLSVLLKSWEILNPLNCELHVFSSSKIYGTQFESSVGDQYDHLYEKCQKLPNVVYRGSVDNYKLREELPYFDILAYPSIFEETSCISVIEALSAGLKVVCSNLGALPETTEGWAEMYPFVFDFDAHVNIFSKVLNKTIINYKNNKYKEDLYNQIQIYGKKWNWNNRIKEWMDFLNEFR